MIRYDIKHELGRHFPVSFRNAVLDRFTAEQEGDRVIVRVSYYHLKAKTTINLQVMLMERELVHGVREDLLRNMGKQMLGRLRMAAKQAKPIEHIKVTLTVQND